MVLSITPSEFWSRRLSDRWRTRFRPRRSCPIPALPPNWRTQPASQSSAPCSAMPTKHQHSSPRCCADNPMTPLSLNAYRLPLETATPAELAAERGDCALLRLHPQAFPDCLAEEAQQASCALATRANPAAKNNTSSASRTRHPQPSSPLCSRFAARSPSSINPPLKQHVTQTAAGQPRVKKKQPLGSSNWRPSKKPY